MSEIERVQAQALLTPALLDAVAHGLVSLEFEDSGDHVMLTVTPVERPEPAEGLAPDVEVALSRERMSVLAAENERLQEGQRGQQENFDVIGIRLNALGGKIDGLDKDVEEINRVVRLVGTPRAPASYGSWALAILVAIDLYASHRDAVADWLQAGVAVVRGWGG